MDNELLKLGAEALRKAALNEDVKKQVLSDPNLFHVFKKAAYRYIGGETMEEALFCIRNLQDEGFFVTTDYMGESIRNESDAIAATAEFIRLIKAFQSAKLSSSISLDLSHIGLLVSEDLVSDNLAAICLEAAKADREVIISMEGTDRTNQIINIYRKTLQAHKNLGITLQAYLHRTKDDLQELIRLPGSIRLVKGAYDTPPGLSLPRGPKLDDVYIGYAEQLLSTDHPCAIASHDHKIHHEIFRCIEQFKPTRYVLEKLLGICDNEFSVHMANGHHCRTYVVYGKEWYLYLCNRLAEYPLNLFLALSDIINAN
jgi:proline dehydrogenase